MKARPAIPISRKDARATRASRIPAPIWNMCILYDHRDFAAGKVLLVREIAICGDQDFKSRRFSGAENLAIS
jgi:hypothetical protein